LLSCDFTPLPQVYKVLALNCLVSAYMMSSLYLQGLKHGDMQMTITGMATAGLFYLISTAKPLPTLSELKPPESVFNLSVMLSIFGQFAVHLACLLLVLYLCHGHFGMAPPVLDVDYPLADSQFRPSLVNSAVYLLYTTFQVNNFFVNFRGPPFTENIWSSKLLSCSFLLVYVFVFLLVSAAVEPLNDSLQLVPFPSFHFKSLLALVLLGDLALTSLVEKMCQQLER
jgi:manganese-transporting P-type ATPase